MAISDEIKVLAEKIVQVKDDLKTEEATKLSLVNPFIYKVLGFDIGNPKEVVPEHKADFRDGTCDKVDYACYLNPDYSAGKQRKVCFLGQPHDMVKEIDR